MKTTFEATDIKAGLRLFHPTSGDAMLVTDTASGNFALLYLSGGNYNVSPWYNATWWLNYLNGPNTGYIAATETGVGTPSFNFS